MKDKLKRLFMPLAVIVDTGLLLFAFLAGHVFEGIVSSVITVLCFVVAACVGAYAVSCFVTTAKKFSAFKRWVIISVSAVLTVSLGVNAFSCYNTNKWWLLIGGFALAFLVAFVLTVATEFYILLSWWHRKHKKSFVIFCSAFGAFVFALAAVETVFAFNMHGITKGSSSAPLYLSSIFKWMVLASLSAVATASLYVKKLRFAAVKSAFVYLLIFTLCFSVCFAVGYDFVQELPENVTTKVIGGMFYLGLSDEDTICIHTCADGTKIYLSEQNKSYLFFNSLEKIDDNQEWHIRIIDGVKYMADLSPRIMGFELSVYRPA